MEQLFP